jgi:hypothetical protein
MRDDLDGCDLDFTEDAISDLEAERLLVPEGDEEDELDSKGNPASPGSPDRGLATRLRKAAVILGAGEPLFKVREVDGWKSRGRDFAGTQPTFNGKGSVNHHTAGAPPSAGNSPSLGIVVHGRSDLPGPLCHVLQAYDDTAIVVAAGTANHAGSGGWKGLSGNSTVYGLEVEHPGTSRVDDKRVTVMASIHAAFLWRPGHQSLHARMTCQHREWSTSGKIDLATNFTTDETADAFRALVRSKLVRLEDGGGEPPPEEGFLMALSDREQQQVLTRSGQAAEFARGVATFFVNYQANGNSFDGLELPAKLDTDEEKGGWKFAYRVQRIFKPNGG